jgi:hypothetical protein
VRASRSISSEPKRSTGVLRVHAGWCPLAAAAQHGAHARQQLARLEGFGQVVVGAHFQADDAVHRVALGGQHDHRHARRIARQARMRRHTSSPSMPGIIRSRMTSSGWTSGSCSRPCVRHRARG